MTLSFLPPPAPVPTAVPGWAKPGSGETPDALAFRAGAALATLHPAAAGLRPETPVALLRERRALQAAEPCLRFMRRS